MTFHYGSWSRLRHVPWNDFSDENEQITQLKIKKYSDLFTKLHCHCSQAIATVLCACKWGSTQPFNLHITDVVTKKSSRDLPGGTVADIEWFALETNRDHFVIFEVASRYCISDSFVDYNGFFISSKGFLPTVVDLMDIWVKFTHSSPS